MPRGRGTERDSFVVRTFRDVRLFATVARSACSWLAKKCSLLIVAGILCVMLLVQVGLLPIGVIIVLSTIIVLIFVGVVMTSMTLLIILPAAILFEIAGTVLRLLIT